MVCGIKRFCLMPFSVVDFCKLFKWCVCITTTARTHFAYAKSALAQQCRGNESMNRKKKKHLTGGTLWYDRMSAVFFFFFFETSTPQRSIFYYPLAALQVVADKGRHSPITVVRCQHRQSLVGHTVKVNFKV